MEWGEIVIISVAILVIAATNMVFLDFVLREILKEVFDVDRDYKKQRKEKEENKNPSEERKD